MKGVLRTLIIYYVVLFTLLAIGRLSNMSSNAISSFSESFKNSVQYTEEQSTKELDACNKEGQEED